MIQAGERFTTNLAAHDQCVWHRPVQKAQAYARIRRVDQATLAFDHQDVVVLVPFDQFFDGTADEVGDHAVDRATVAGNHDPRLSGGDELGVLAGAVERTSQFYRRQHLANAAVLADSQDAQTVSSDSLAASDVGFVVLADVTQLDAVLRGGRGKFFIVGQKLMQSTCDIHAARNGVQNDRPPRRWHLSTWGRGAQQQHIGRRGVIERSHYGNVATDSQQRLCRLTDLSAVDQGDDRVFTIADHAARRFGGARIGLAFGKDNYGASHSTGLYV